LPTVNLTDQFGEHDGVTLDDGGILCNPVSKTLIGSGGSAIATYGVNNPAGHLQCYQLTGTAVTGDGNFYQVTSQFGTYKVVAAELKELCLPTFKYDPNADPANPLAVAGSISPSAWTDPNKLELDHMACWFLTVWDGPTTNPTIQLQDQFGKYTTVDLDTQPSLLCAPVIKAVIDPGTGLPGAGSDTNSDGLNGAHLLCYDVLGASSVAHSNSVEVGNQFTTTPAGVPGLTPNPVTFTIAAGGVPHYLCLPSFKILFPGTGLPETPLTLLLPVAAGMVAVGAVLVAMRRNASLRRRDSSKLLG
jgi:hypothetical protein